LIKKFHEQSLLLVELAKLGKVLEIGQKKSKLPACIPFN